MEVPHQQLCSPAPDPQPRRAALPTGLLLLYERSIALPQRRADRLGFCVSGLGDIGEFFGFFWWCFAANGQLCSSLPLERKADERRLL